MSIVQTEWYNSLVDDCKTIIERAKINAGIILIEAKYDLGNRILPEYKKFGRREYGNKTQEDFANDLETTHQNISENIRFAKKINEEYGDFTQFKQSSDASELSWRQLVREWLPKKKQFQPVETPPLPEGIFNVIYADPPWEYQFSPTYSRSIEAHYPSMKLKDICELRVPSADDSILFLWATSPKLEEAMQVLESWGFEYRTSMVWVKDKIGMGHYVRGQHELLLIGRKGSMPTPDPSTRPSSVIVAPRLEHSQKPTAVYDLIEKMYPTSTYLELFSRGERVGWTMWGHKT